MELRSARTVSHERGCKALQARVAGASADRPLLLNAARAASYDWADPSDPR